MIFYENRLLADDCHKTSYLIIFGNLGKMAQNLSSAAVVIGALRVYLISVFHLSQSCNQAIIVTVFTAYF